MGLAWLSQPAKQFHGRCSHWQSTTWPQPERKGQNLCKHASFTHPQHAIVHAIRECHSCPALLPLQLVHSLCSNIFHAHKQFRVLGVLSSLMLKSKVVQRLLPVLHGTPLAANLISQLLSLSSLQDKVGSRTLEGRRLRRHVLKGAVIVFITAGYSGKKFIFEKVLGDAHQTPWEGYRALITLSC